MKKFLFSSIYFLLIFTSINSYSQNSSSLEFVENKGQWDSNVRFKGELNTGAFFLTNTGFTVLQHNSADLSELKELNHGHTETGLNHNTSLREASEKPILRSHAYEVEFINANKAEVVAEELVIGYNNYFIGSDPAKWAANCKIYKVVTYKNIYPNVDVKYYTENGNLKYDIIVKPGGDPGRIAMRYNGADSLMISDNELVVKTSTGDIKELAPYSYESRKGESPQVGCRFKLSGNIVQFEVDAHAKNDTLVMSPQLVFSTFTGSSADNWGHTATYGHDGSFYAGGTVFSNGFPVNTGAFQTSFGGGASEGGKIGGHDIGIIKFNSTGTNREYATYFGGSGNEQPHSLIVDSQGNLVIAGRTSSASTFPKSTLVGAGGGYDIFITKLNALGTDIIGSMRIGGSADDGINILAKHAGVGAIFIRRNYGDDARSEVILDNNDNIYFASCTQSTRGSASQNFPATPGAFQRAPGQVGAGFSQDGILIKTNPNLTSILFSTYLGGNHDDAAFVLSLNPVDNNIYVGGSTVSTNFPGTGNSPVIKSAFQGGVCDGFVSIVSNDGSRLIKSTHIGGAGNDMLYGLQFDQEGFPYVMGTTTVAFPVINSSFTSQANGKQFISKIRPDLSSYIYSTNFGTVSNAPNLSPVAFSVDQCQNVYVSGWGGGINVSSYSPYPNSSTNGLTVVAPSGDTAIQSMTDGSDFYFFVLKRDATEQLYGSFWGQRGGETGEHVDGGMSRFDKNGVVYQAVCANCGGTARYPTTPGAWSTTNGSISCNLAALKIAFNFCSGSLPIHLLTFSAKKNGKENKLEWTTSQEINANNFEIERSINGRDFKSIGKVSANGNNSRYGFVDKLPGGNVNYYRLKMIDKDGKFEYSTVRSINNNVGFAATIYPNPTRENVTVRIESGKTADLQLEVVGLDGKVLIVKQVLAANGTITNSIDITTLTSGSYFLRVKSSNKEISTFKFEKL